MHTLPLSTAKTAVSTLDFGILLLCHIPRLSLYPSPFCMSFSLSGRWVTPVGQVSVTCGIVSVSADIHGNRIPSSLQVTMERSAMRDIKLMNISALHQETRERVWHHRQHVECFLLILTHCMSTSIYPRQLYDSHTGFFGHLLLCFYV